jgi:hypothetical protein
MPASAAGGASTHDADLRQRRAGHHASETLTSSELDKRCKTRSPRATLRTCCMRGARLYCGRRHEQHAAGGPCLQGTSGTWTSSSNTVPPSKLSRMRPESAEEYITSRSG